MTKKNLQQRLTLQVIPFYAKLVEQLIGEEVVDGDMYYCVVKIVCSFSNFVSHALDTELLPIYIHVPSKTSGILGLISYHDI